MCDEMGDLALCSMFPAELPGLSILHLIGTTGRVKNTECFVVRWLENDVCRGCVYVYTALLDCTAILDFVPELPA